MTKQERLATMRALQDILQARRSATFGGGMSNMGGAPPQIPVDPRLNKPQPPGNGGKQAVHDPDNILGQRQSTPVQLPDGQQAAQNDGDSEGTDGSDSQDGSNSGAQNGTSASDNAKNQEDPGDSQGNSPTGGGDQSDDGEGQGQGHGDGAQAGEKAAAEDKKTSQDDDEFADYKSPDYKKGWNNIIAKYDRDDVTEQELQDLISQIESGVLQI